MNLFLKLKKVILEKRLIKTLKKKAYPYLRVFHYFLKLITLILKYTLQN